MANLWKMGRGIFLLLLVMNLTGLGNTILAAEPDNGSDNEDSAEEQGMEATVGKGLSLAKCFAKGGWDFFLFMEAVWQEEWDTPWEMFYEPWLDVLIMNSCQQVDILGLLKQRLKIREQIRGAFLTCNTQKLPGLKKAFAKMNAEIYYVRHIIKKEWGDYMNYVGNLLPYDVLRQYLENEPEKLFADSQELFQDMQKRYVNDEELDQQEFELLFEVLETKYQERKKQFVICDENPWEQVVEKWHELEDTFSGFDEEWQKTVVNKWESGVVKAWNEMVELGVVGFLEKTFRIGINNFDLVTGFNEIMGDVLKKYEESGFSDSALQPTISEVQQGINYQAYKKDLEQLKAEMSSEYYVLYQGATNATISEFMKELQAFNETLSNSLVPMEKVYKCVDKVSSRQCPGP